MDNSIICMNVELIDDREKCINKNRCIKCLEFDVLCFSFIFIFWFFFFFKYFRLINEYCVYIYI